jgi:HD superfamily phosphohydrolase
MKPTRIDFYDPLYDFVTFEEAARPRARQFLDAGFARRGASTHGDSISSTDEAKAILPFLNAVEFARQGFVRQSNLAFLVYPSATHTRLAHAIGSCYLGFLASQRVAVKKGLRWGKGEMPTYLSQLLEDTGWREEFYLALLLHDVGHFPFSHALENNLDYWECFGKRVLHEEAACELILGKGPIFDSAERRVSGISLELRRNHPQLAEIFHRERHIERNAVCYLITGDTKAYIKGRLRSASKHAELRVLHELVSGLLDLDRLDHYRRDNLFTGLRSGASVNFPSLLSGLTICYDPHDPSQEPQLHLSSSAVGHAISLLQNKERLTEDCFEHPDNIAYEVMLHRAFNLFMLGDDFYEADEDKRISEEVRRHTFDMFQYTDEELLLDLRSRGSNLVKDLVFRIMYRDPYPLAAKLIFPLQHRKSLREIRRAISSSCQVRRSDLVLRASKGFGTRKLSNRTREWLDLERLLHSNGKRLADGKYKRQIDHFKQVQDITTEVLWIYSTAQNFANKIERALPQICRELGCEPGEL